MNTPIAILLAGVVVAATVAFPDYWQVVSVGTITTAIRFEASAQRPLSMLQGAQMII